MELFQNTGSDRVIDLIRLALAPGYRLDLVTVGLSRFMFADTARYLHHRRTHLVVRPETNGEGRP